jgi:ssDNA-specific exonuclease RecJ
MKSWLKKITGIEKLEQQRAESLANAAEAKVQEDAAKKAEALAKMTPKERASAKGEPWVSVLDTHVNKDNIRNGFFELDWNELFVLQLKQEGYGFDGDPDEEIVDRWFRDIVRNMLSEEGQDVTRAAGYINVKPITPGKSEVS